MGSIAGAILTGLGLGVVEGLTKVFYPQASSISIFVIMIIVLLIKPAGLFGKSNTGHESSGGGNITNMMDWEMYKRLFYH